MGSGAVVMVNVFVQDPLEVVAVHDQEPVRREKSVACFGFSSSKFQASLPGTRAVARQHPVA